MSTHYKINIKKYLDSSERANIAITNKEWFKNSEDYKLIQQETEWVNILNPDITINKRIILIKDGIKDFKKCIYCGGNIKFSNTLNKTPNFCSKSCSCNSSKEKRLLSHRNNNIAKIDKQTIKTLEETKEYIKKEFSKNAGIYEQQAITNGYYKSIEHYNTIENVKFIVKMYNILHNIVEFPVCLYHKCDNMINKFVNGYVGYRTYCSVSCQVIDNTDKRKETYFDKTGYKHFSHKPGAKIIKEQNSMIKWGYKVPQLHPDVLAKVEKTSMERYGVRNYNQLGTVINFPRFKFKEYVLPSGSIISYQGYEDKLLDELLLEYNEDEIKNQREDIPPIWYIGLDNKSHRYFPDVYVPKTNTIYEVKSEYTLNVEHETNILKFQAVKDAGYNFVLRVY